jgi:hypothetical protein
VKRLLMGPVVVALGACGAVPVQAVGGVVTAARADQLAFAVQQQERIALRGTVQKKGLKPTTMATTSFTGGPAPGTATTSRYNVNYGYVFLGEGSATDKRALCLFDPGKLPEAAALQLGQTATFECLFSKFVGSGADLTPVFWDCSVR